MSNGAHRRQRRRRGSGRSQRQPGGPVRTFRALDTYQGVPVYDGIVVDVALFDDPLADPESPPADARVLVGIGPEGAAPVAYVTLCPCDGVAGLAADLTRQGATAAEFHPPHGVRPT